MLQSRQSFFQLDTDCTDCVRLCPIEKEPIGALLGPNCRYFSIPVQSRLISIGLIRLHCKKSCPIFYKEFQLFVLFLVPNFRIGSGRSHRSHLFPGLNIPHYTNHTPWNPGITTGQNRRRVSGPELFLEITPLKAPLGHL